MPYRSPPCPDAAPVTLTVTLVWGPDTIAVAHLFDAGEAGVGDVPASLAPIPCDALGVAGLTFATLAGGVARAHVPAGAAATLCRPGGRDVRVDGPTVIELGAGDACELGVGDFTLRAAAEARQPAPPRLRGLGRPVWLVPIAVVAAIHAAVLSVAPRSASWRTDEAASGVDLAALRAMLGGDKPGPGHEVEDARPGPPIHVEGVEAAPDEPPEEKPAPVRPPVPKKKPAPPKPPAPTPADVHAKLHEAALGAEPTTGAEATAPARPGTAGARGADAEGTPPPPAPNNRAANVAKTAGQRVFASAQSPEALPATSDEDPLLCFLSPERKPMPWVRYRLTFESGETRSGIANWRGAVTLRGMKAPLRGKATWGRRKGDFEYSGDFVIFNASRGETAAEQRDAASDALNNLGFRGSSLEERVRAFQAREGHRAHPPLAVTGQLDRRTWELLWKVHDNVCG